MGKNEGQQLYGRRVQTLPEMYLEQSRSLIVGLTPLLNGWHPNPDNVLLDVVLTIESLLQSLLNSKKN